jgi:acyl-CoA reductase-like NAD-dependent aldehyde dehydrogenase
MLRILLLGAPGPIAWADPIMKDEIFVPIPPILTYESSDEAFVRVAEGPRPLAAFIFTRSQAAIDRFVGELSFGGGAVNQVNIHLFIESMPFGGVGPAGMGHYYGKVGFRHGDARQVDVDLAAGRGDRAPLPALHGRKECRSQGVV